jgi:hypothetical protein
MGKTAVFVISTLQQLEPVDGQVGSFPATCGVPSVLVQGLMVSGGYLSAHGASSSLPQLHRSLVLKEHPCLLACVQVSVVVLCHTRELAYQICHEYERFTTYMKVGCSNDCFSIRQSQRLTLLSGCKRSNKLSSRTGLLLRLRPVLEYLSRDASPFSFPQNVRVGNFFGGLPIKQQREQLKDKDKCPHIIVGTPGRVKGVSDYTQLQPGHSCGPARPALPCHK